MSAAEKEKQAESKKTDDNTTSTKTAVRTASGVPRETIVETDFIFDSVIDVETGFPAETISEDGERGEIVQVNKYPAAVPNYPEEVARQRRLSEARGLARHDEVSEIMAEGTGRAAGRAVGTGAEENDAPGAQHPAGANEVIVNAETGEEYERSPLKPLAIQPAGAAVEAQNKAAQDAAEADPDSKPESKRAGTDKPVSSDDK